MAPYYWALRLRHRLYDSGKKKSFRSPVRTIVVGNITVGGTGKTPFVEMLLGLLDGRGAAVLSRGYGRKTKGFLEVCTDGTSRQFGDEPLQIKRKFPDVRVAVDADRVEGCRILAEQGAECIILDDAFQHRRLIPDLAIVLVDWSRPVYEDDLLPLGRLRDIPERLEVADVVVVTKCPAYISREDREAWREKLRLREDQTLLFTEIAYCDMEPVFGNVCESRYKYSTKAVSVTAIASDGPFKNYVSSKFELEKTISFGDHHDFSAGDISGMQAVAEHYPNALFLTTEKDAQRLRAVSASLPHTIKKRLYYIPIQARFCFPEDQQTLAGLL